MTRWTQRRQISPGEAYKQRWKDVQQVRMIKDKDGNTRTGSTSMMERWKEN